MTSNLESLPFPSKLTTPMPSFGNNFLLSRKKSRLLTSKLNTVELSEKDSDKDMEVDAQETEELKEEESHERKRSDLPKTGAPFSIRTSIKRLGHRKNGSRSVALSTLSTVTDGNFGEQKPLKGKKLSYKAGTLKRFNRAKEVARVSFSKRKSKDDSPGASARSTAGSIEAAGDTFTWMEAQRMSVKKGSKPTERLVRKKVQEIIKRLSLHMQNNLLETQTKGGKKQKPKRRGFSKEVLRREWIKTFGPIEIDLFDKLFETMDHDRDGLVDETEFTVVLLFLLKQGKESENSKLVFSLFDADKNNRMSQQEFSDMLSIIIGNTIESVVKLSKIKAVFEDYLKTEFCEENLQFYYEIKKSFKQFDDEIYFFDLPLSKVKQINEEFIETTGEQCINISSDQRSKILQTVQEAEGEGKEKISSSIYESAFYEVKYLLEAGTLYRFKMMLQKSPFTKLTTEVWEMFGLRNTDELTYEQFQQWSEDNPGIFNFMKDLQKKFAKQLRDAAYKWAENTSKNVRASVKDLEEVIERKPDVRELNI